MSMLESVKTTKGRTGTVIECQIYIFIYLISGSQCQRVKDSGAAGEAKEEEEGEEAAFCGRGGI